MAVPSAAIVRPIVAIGPIIAIVICSAALVDAAVISSVVWVAIWIVPVGIVPVRVIAVAVVIGVPRKPETADKDYAVPITTMPPITVPAAEISGRTTKIAATLSEIAIPLECCRGIPPDRRETRGRLGDRRS